MAPRSVAPAVRAAVELFPPDEEMGAALILAAVDAGAIDLVDTVLATFTPDEQDRILVAVRLRTRQRLVGYANPDGSGRGNWSRRVDLGGR